MTNRIDLWLVQYKTGERRVVDVRDAGEDTTAAASEFLPAGDTDGPLLDYDLSCDMTADEMAAVRDLQDGLIVLREEQFGLGGPGK